jgi:hypothetical protein
MNRELPQVQLDDDCDRTRQWLQALLRERISPELNLRRDHESSRWSLQIESQPGVLWVGDGLLGSKAPIRDAPCVLWNAEHEGWRPALPGLLPAPGQATAPSTWVSHSSDGWWLRYDAISLAFHMLSRSEEVNHHSPDRHGRFPASASHAALRGYLGRPVVDEWMHVLRQIAERAWPGIRLVPQHFAVQPSHDVDFPSRYALRSFSSYARAAASDLIRRRRLADVAWSPWWRARGATSLHPRDPANTFDWLMRTSEHHSLRSAFYFICGRTAPEFDAGYEVEQPAVTELMRRVNQRGHEIGLHPSYGSYLQPELIAYEAQRLRRVCASLGIQQTTWGGRMHFLRWSNPETPRAWAGAGMSYDATLTYADRAGFRCGTCFDYPAFDPVARQALPLRIRPLVAMECSVMDPAYMGLGTGAEAFDEFVRLKQACRAVGGTFSLLWHNTELDTPVLRDLYRSVLAH